MHNEDIINMIRSQAQRYKAEGVDYGTAPRGFYSGEDVKCTFAKAVALEEMAADIERVLAGAFEDE